MSSHVLTINPDAGNQNSGAGTDNADGSASREARSRQSLNFAVPQLMPDLCDFTDLHMGMSSDDFLNSADFNIFPLQ